MTPRSTSSSTIGSDDAGLLEVGRVGRPHGVRGDLLVTLTTNRTERMTPGQTFDVDGTTVTVRSARPYQGRWLVHFAGVDGRDQAARLAGLALRAEPLDDPGALWSHDLIGCRVVDQHDVERGVVVALQANPASDLLVLEDGALVPLRFLVDGPDDGVIRVDVPDGLFEL